MAFKHRLPLNYYSPSWLSANLGETVWNKTLRSEYSYMRNLANKRLATIEKSEWKESNYYKRVSKEFPRLSEIKNEQQLQTAIVSVYRFLESDTGTLTGLRSRMKTNIKELQVAGYTQINSSNYIQYIDFMSSSAAAGLNKIYGSDVVQDIVVLAIDAGIGMEELLKRFDEFVENRNVLIEKKSNARPTSSADLQRRFRREQSGK